jgi:hypothetical protein
VIVWIGMACTISGFGLLTFIPSHGCTLWI